MELAVQVARSLEEGRGGLVSRVASSVWGALATRSLVKRLVFRDDARVIAVSGSTLGGSGKTPLAIACARHLAETGHRVAYVGHAYTAAPGRARVVRVDDDLTEVGDEALLAARELAPFHAVVTVAPARQAALDLALTKADIAIVDGVAQLRPVRAHLALLAVDGSRPWGAGRCPPSGDLRAPRAGLLALSDRVVSVGGAPGVGVVSEAVGVGSERLPWDEVRARRVGLWTRVARPERVALHLATHGVTPVFVMRSADHATVSARELARAAKAGHERGVDLWLSTPKCAVGLPDAVEGVPVGTLEYQLRLEGDLKDALRDAAERGGRR